MTSETRKQTIAILFGGRSSEHGISCVTAAGVLHALDRSRFDAVLIGITRDGEMVLKDEASLADYRLDAPSLPEVSGDGARVLWPSRVGERELSVIEDGAVLPLVRIDAVLPMLHGPYGEDGTVQGLLDLVDMPYVGSGVLASALCMDKHVAKLVCAAADIPVAPWHTITVDLWEEMREDQGASSAASSLAGDLEFPLYVKPARAGSSVGVSRVASADEIPAALELAFHEDRTVLIEQGVTGREVEIAVLEGRHGTRPRTSSVIGEIVIEGRDFYDFESKYLGGDGVRLELPADVTEKQFTEITRAAVRAFEVTQCQGLARIDFFLTADGPVLNEVNTLPGFTPISMYPQLWEYSGLPYSALITELIELALEKRPAY